MKKTNFTFNQRERLRNDFNSKFKVISITALFSLLMGMSSMVHAQCKLSCIGHFNISLDANGMDTITPARLLSDTCTDTDDLVIKVVIGADTFTNYVFTCADISSEAYDVGVYNEAGNNCWSKVNIQDKMPPIIDCQNDTVTCAEAYSEPLYTVTDNCSTSDEITVRVLDELSFVPIECEPGVEPMFTGYIPRRLQATDKYGNTTPEFSICEDTLWIERMNFDSIKWPTHQTGAADTLDPALSCDATDWVDWNGDFYPDPGEPGVNVPSIHGRPLLPGTLLDCNVSVDHEDKIAKNNCYTKIFRTYTVREWVCNSPRDTQYLHMIIVKDEKAPVFEPVANVSMTTNGSDICEGTAYIPKPVVTDNCTEISEYQVVTPFGIKSYSSVQGVFVTLPAGDHQVILRAYDQCKNLGSDTLTVSILDMTSPVAVCDQNTTVTLTNNGLGRVHATTIDDGSYDDCGVEKVEIRRMGVDCNGKIHTDADFAEYVEFCCEDIANSPIQVIFRVTDKSGNTNICMVNVTVQDKLNPQVTCLPNITVSCEMDINLNDVSIFGKIHVLESLDSLGVTGADPRKIIEFVDPGYDDGLGTFPNTAVHTYGIDGYVYDNCHVTLEELPPFDARNSCGVGYIRRRFIFKNIAGEIIPSLSCSQIIEVKNTRPFSDEIIWPEDLVVSEKCNVEELNPDYLAEKYGIQNAKPQLEETGCSRLSTSFSDMVFTNSKPDPSIGCYKIMRTWKVMDWCSEEDPKPIYESTQVIVVSNNIAPHFVTSCEDVTVFNTDPECGEASITLNTDAEDDCTPATQLDYTYTIYPFGDKNSPNVIIGTGKTVTRNFAIGTHTIVWRVEDNCGNWDRCEYDFTVDNRKAPTPVCINGISIEIMPVDTDGNGVADAGMLDIKPDIIDRGTSHACGIGFTLSFSADKNDTIRSYTCDDIGRIDIELWAHAENGTTARCRTYVLLQANEDQCGVGNNGPSLPVSGLISGLSDEGVPSVNIKVKGSSMESKTSDNGEYRFVSMEKGNDYEVVPSLNINFLNGVTAWDLTLIQKHILGIEDLENPYLIVAADVNNDGKVSGKDLTTLRRTILGIDEAFLNNTSWRFIDEEYHFGSSDPLSEDFPESYNIKNLNTAMSSVNFKAIKIGDVNNSVDVKEAGVIRSENGVILSMNDVMFQVGEQIEIPVTSATFKEVNTLQYTMNFNADNLEFVALKSGAIKIDNDNMALLDNGVLTTTWFDIDAQSFDTDDVLFTFVFNTKGVGRISNDISINSSITPALAVVSGEEKGVQVDYRSTGNTARRYALFQNVPNPASNLTVIGFELAEESTATLSIRNVTGQIVKQIDGQFNRGYNEVTINSKDLGSAGLYYYTLEAGEFTASKKMVVFE